MPSSMLSILDDKNQAMIIIMEEQKIAQLLSMSKIKEIAATNGISPQIVQHRRDYWIYENSGATYLDTFCR